MISALAKKQHDWPIPAFSVWEERKSDGTAEIEPIGIGGKKSLVFTGFNHLGFALPALPESGCVVITLRQDVASKSNRAFFCGAYRADLCKNNILTFVTADAVVTAAIPPHWHGNDHVVGLYWGPPRWRGGSSTIDTRWSAGVGIIVDACHLKCKSRQIEPDAGPDAGLFVGLGFTGLIGDFLIYDTPEPLAVAEVAVSLSMREYGIPVYRMPKGV